MKKKILSFLVAICMVLPFGFALTACGGHTHTASTEWVTDDEKHWKVCTDTECAAKLDEADHEFTEETVAATIDAAGKVVKTCETCGKVIETPIPKIVQTEAEMIAVLPNAVKLDNYKGAIQEVYTYKTNTEDYVSVSSTEEVEIEYRAIKEDGTAVYYVTNNQKPDSYEAQEYIREAAYLEKVGTEYRLNRLYLDNDKTKIDLDEVYRVGSNYSQSYVLDGIKNNLDYLLEIEDKDTMITVLKNTLSRYIPMYQEMAAGYFNDTFTYDVNDIEVSATFDYVDGCYVAEGTIVLDKLTHTNPEATQKMNDFMVEFEVVYKNDIVVENNSTFIYHIDTTPAEADDELTEIYIVNNFAYSKLVENSHFEKINSIVDNSQADVDVYDRQEEVRIHINGKIFTTEYARFGTAINTAVEGCVTEYLVNTGIDDYSRIEMFLDEDCTVPYVQSQEVLAVDYYGNDVYIKITPNQGYSLVITNYIYRLNNVDFEIVAFAKVEVVEMDGLYTIDHTQKDYTNPSTDIEYDDKTMLNGTQLFEASFEVELSEYSIDLYYITNAMM